MTIFMVGLYVCLRRTMDNNNSLLMNEYANLSHRALGTWRSSNRYIFTMVMVH